MISFLFWAAVVVVAVVVVVDLVSRPAVSADDQPEPPAPMTHAEAAERAAIAQRRVKRQEAMILGRLHHALLCPACDHNGFVFRDGHPAVCPWYTDTAVTR